MSSDNLLYQIPIAVPFFFPTLAMLCIRGVCRQLPSRAIEISLFASMISLAVFYFLHLTLNGRLPNVYTETSTDGQAGLGDALISFMSFIAYPVAVAVVGFTLYRDCGNTNENKMG